MGKTLEELAKGEERERYHGWLGKLTQGWVEFPRPKADGAANSQAPTGGGEDLVPSSNGNVMELTDIAGVHRQNTGSTTEMVQPVFHSTYSSVTGNLNRPRPKADGLNVEERELDRISGSGKSVAHEAIEPSEAIDKI